MLASAPSQLQHTARGLGVVQVLGSCWKAPNHSRGSVTPIYSNLLFMRTRQARLSSVGLPPLPRLTPHSASCFRMGSRPKSRGSPRPEPPPAGVLPRALSSPALGRPGAPPRGGAWWPPAGLAAAPVAGRPRRLARPPAHVHEEERSASRRRARASHRWVPHLGGWRGP